MTVKVLSGEVLQSVASPPCTQASGLEKSQLAFSSLGSGRTYFKSPERDGCEQRNSTSIHLVQDVRATFDFPEDELWSQFAGTISPPVQPRLLMYVFDT